MSKIISNKEKETCLPTVEDYEKYFPSGSVFKD